MGELSPATIVFLVVLGAGAVVVIGHTVIHRCTVDPEEVSSRSYRTDLEGGSQGEYMRSVRTRNRTELQRFAGY